jgi:monofunctional biosynthetic peptidoglycan transglycosylase
VRAVGRLLRRLRLACWIALLALIGDLVYVAGMSPEWDLYAEGPIQKSSFMKRYERERAREGWPRLRWRPVPLASIPPHVIQAVLAAEDSRFYDHAGFDRDAFEEAMEQNLARRRVIYGGSTISQQTVKNLLLGPSRNPVRKWHELLLTLGMELSLEKRRILEIYLNVAEFGVGVYGVEAAARAYWGVGVSELSRRQAAELAATLPAPRTHNPKTRTEFFRARSAKLLRQMREV